MKPTHPPHRRQPPAPRNLPLAQNSSIDVDGVKVYEIQEYSSSIESIHVEPQMIASQRKQFRRMVMNGKSRSQQAQNIRYSGSRDSIAFNMETSISSELLSQRWRQKTLPLLEHKANLHKFLSHFLSIKERTPTNKIHSQQFYNLFQGRKSLQHKLDPQVSAIGYLFEMEYTNYLSFLRFVIEQKQLRYDVYSEEEELEKVLSLIEGEIQDMIQIYFAEQQAKSKFIYSEDLFQQIQEIQKNTQPHHESNMIAITCNIEQQQIICQKEQSLLDSDEEYRNLRPFTYEQKQKKHIDVSQLDLQCKVKSQAMDLEEQKNEEAECFGNNIQPNKMFTSMEERQIFTHIQTPHPCEDQNDPSIIEQSSRIVSDEIFTQNQEEQLNNDITPL